MSQSEAQCLPCTTSSVTSKNAGTCVTTFPKNDHAFFEDAANERKRELVAFSVSDGSEMAAGLR